jgi:uncharacterized integral membrane protein
MRVQGVIYIVAAVVIAIFAAANWELLVRPVEMNLLLVRVQAPLAVLLLLLAGIILLLDSGVHISSERAWVRDRRALARELEAARLRTEQEGENRTAAVTTAIHNEFAVVRDQLDRVLAAQSAWLGRSGAVEAPDGGAHLHGAIEPELIPPRTPSDPDAGHRDRRG